MKTLIYGGRVIDPANGTDAILDLLIEDGRIARAGRMLARDADEMIDASGKIVAPGFIDIHMHEDPVGPAGIEYSIFNSMLLMGVTTAVGGNCGSSKCGDPLAYLALVDRDGAPVNVGMLAPHGYYRVKAGAKDKYARSTQVQREEMVRMLCEALDGGCLGLSFGVRYYPGTDAEELDLAAQCCCGTGKLIAAHVRDDAAYIFESIDELAQLGVKFGLPVQVSHIGSMGGFGQMQEVLRQLDEYRLNGLDIAADCYPYCAFSTSVGTTTYDDGWLERYDCDYDVLEFCTGKYKGQRATEATFREMRAEDPGCITVCHVMRSEDVDAAYRHPRVMVGSDGVTDKGQGHPRAAGTFPRFLAQYVRGGGISLYDGIAKMTSMPAARLGLTDKGRLNVGADADVVIFDPERICDRATFAEPALAPVGIDAVLVAGKVAVRDGEIVAGRLGRAVRG